MAECTALNQVLRTTQCARATRISGMCDTYQILGFWPVLLILLQYHPKMVEKNTV